MKETALIVVCDLDGTLCDVQHRVHFVEQDPKDYKSFFEALGDDTVREDVYNSLEMCAKNMRIIFITGRPEEYRQLTLEWLNKHISKRIPWYGLYMRPTGDSRPAVEVKKELFEKFVDSSRVRYVFEDNPKLIDMWQGFGLRTIDCSEDITTSDL